MTKVTETEKNEAIASLLKALKPGSIVYTACSHVSSSGMTRHISLYIVEGKEIRDITWLARRALGYRIARNGGLVVGGAGMDMGFHVVYSLGATIWPNGTRKPHGTRNGEPDKAGGYALKHRWL